MKKFKKNTHKKAQKRQPSKAKNNRANKTTNKTIKTLVKDYSNKTGVLPLGNRVLIKPFTKEELQAKNSFGIILPDSGSKDKSEQGLVVAVGSGEYRDGKVVPVAVKIGDKIAFSKYGYEDITVGGEEFYLIKEENILAILK